MRRFLVYAAFLLLAICLALPGVASGQSLPDTVQGSTVLLFGGTNNPDAVGMQDKLDGQLVVGADEIKEIRTPQQFGPIYGDMTYDESRRIGGESAKTAILEAQAEGDDVVLVGYSQSASENSEALGQMAREGVPLDNVTAVSIANPRTPGSGIETRGISLPGVTAMGSAPNVVKGYSICWVQDPVGNAPAAERLSNPLVAINALLGYRDYHGRYDNVDLSTARSYERDGVTYITLDDGKTPVIEGMHQAGIFLSEETENGIKKAVKPSEPGPGPVAPVASPAPLAPEAPVTPVAAVETAQELPFTNPVEVFQQQAADFVETSQEFVETVTQQPVYEDVSPAPSQMEQVSTAIDNTADMVKSDPVLQQIIPSQVVNQAAANLNNLVGQFMP
jgi:hypothetical protein